MDNDLESITDSMIFAEFDGMYAWSPGQPKDNLPCEQVHLVSRIPGLKGMILVWRFKSREGTDQFIRDLQKLRDEVWPTEKKVQP